METLAGSRVREMESCGDGLSDSKGQQVVLPFVGGMSATILASLDLGGDSWSDVMQGLVNAEQKLRDIAAQVDKLRAQFGHAAEALKGPA